eukprot:CAMPEP_0197530558 /NCGR_PEP_ID=MMETSP1318-20131121/32214_1 /TAXON_ID=552666 /ORGANISM="Partenskyella glossopodia, Strain RCC365" /LENGTH=589 /DNA_ID=CAMNT_0043086449 /DNA_START=108 /DNA_END=1880 /DNA_ORIENTATION=+
MPRDVGEHQQPGEKRPRQDAKLASPNKHEKKESKNAQPVEPKRKRTEPKAVQITLVPMEQKIFGCIKQMLLERGMKTTVRVAGGWVRDKCLGKESDDIDIAVDDMTGEEFAKCVVDYLSSQGEEARSIGVIKANPDKSKHLATATFSIFGVHIDVNNLRSEEYAESSRIPTTRLGTAEEDASRRDFTVNALFYNINEERVEDLTGKGLIDLEKKILRTPLEALQTFIDDPLRVLRAIRFSARFGFALAADLTQAAKQPRIQSDLENKVSRERFSIELNKVVGGVGSPTDAFELLVDFGLHGIVFKEPESLVADEDVKERQERPGDAVGTAGLRVMRTVETMLKIRGTAKEERRIALYAAFMSPYHGYKVKVKKKFQPAIRYILRESAKVADSAIAEAASKLVDCAKAFASIATRAADASAAPAGAPDPMRAILRNTGQSLNEIKERYILALDLAYALTAETKWLPEFKSLASEAATTTLEYPNNSTLSRYATWIQNSGLLDCWKWKPLVSSKDIIQKMQISGRAVGEMVRRQLLWRFENPFGTRAEALAFLEQSFRDEPPPAVAAASNSRPENKKSKKKKTKQKKKKKK